MSYNRFLELLLRQKSGEVTLRETEELNQFLEDNPEFIEVTGIVDQFYDSSLKEVKEIDESYIRERWASLNERIQLSVKPEPGSIKKINSKRIRNIAIAASVIGVLFSGLYFLNASNPEKQEAKDVVLTTNMGSKSNMKLPDGSTVWLNAGSEISYGSDFGKTSRDIQLSGEAFFDVVHNDKLPFVVHTQHFNIKVLGTAFNVRSYPSDAESQATLLRGKIELSFNNDNTSKIILKPNEKLIFNAGTIKKSEKENGPAKTDIKISGLERPFKDSMTVETQWLNDKLAFRNMRLEEVAALISRWYGVSIEINDSELKDKEFSGLFEDETVKQVMEALRLTGGFHYTMNKNKITIVQ